MPHSVLHAAIQQQIEVEKNPDKFHRLTMRPLLRQTRSLVFVLLGPRCP